ncbi:hypothetical protein DSM112329_03852 [Paraconexibacter sp. AEG42_29]|uniref:Secreted protein n=1 Tax=Paraconexibacter sp. AEG42_29 TaxID=2997339 RepID=A0AAU7AZA0_9ACTN
MRSAFRPVVCGTVLSCCLALAACGGDDSSSPGSSTTTPATSSSTSTAAAAAATAPTVAGVLSCLQSAGVKAETQTSVDDSEYVGIDYGSDRTTIYVEPDAEAAELKASLGEQYGQVVREGNVVAVIDPAGTDDQDAVEACIKPGASAPAAATAPSTAASDTDEAAAAGTDDDPASASTTLEEPYAVGALAADFPTDEQLRRCLLASGVPARDKGATKTAGTVEIAHPDDTLTSISFETNEGEAKAVEAAVQEFGKVLRIGTIVAVMAPAGEKYAPAIEDCVQGGE